MVEVCLKEDCKFNPSNNCSCNGDGTGKEGDEVAKPCARECTGCGSLLDCACRCCRRVQPKICAGITVPLLIVAFIIYYLATHPLPDLQKVRDYFSDIFGNRKFRFIPRSELDAPKITHITEEMDINPYSFFPSKDLM